MRIRNKRLLLVFLLADAVFFAAIAFLLVGRFQHERFLAACKNMLEIRITAERYAVDHQGAFPPSMELAIQDGYIEGLPQNPYSGQPMRLVHAGGKLSPGDYCYLVEESEGEIINVIPLGLAPKPSLEQMAWARLSYRFEETRLKRLGCNEPLKAAGLYWLGGECGNVIVWIAPGLTPDEACKQAADKEQRSAGGSLVEGKLRIYDPARVAASDARR
jgi:hypothetical protein